MNSGRTVFSQLIDHLPVHEFRKCVARYRGNHRTRTFSCWDQFLCLAFAQLTYRESLRDIVTCLKALKGGCTTWAFVAGCRAARSATPTIVATGAFTPTLRKS
jgi:hypothetical protein